MPRQTAARAAEMRAGAVELRAQGLSWDAISAELGISRSRLRVVMASRPEPPKPVEDLPPLDDFRSRRDRLLDLWLLVAERGVVAAAANLEPKSTLAAAIAVDKVLKLSPSDDGVELSELEQWLLSRRAIKPSTIEPNGQSALIPSIYDDHTQED